MPVGHWGDATPLPMLCPAWSKEVHSSGRLHDSMRFSFLRDVLTWSSLFLRSAFWLLGDGALEGERQGSSTSLKLVVGNAAKPEPASTP